MSELMKEALAADELEMIPQEDEVSVEAILLADEQNAHELTQLAGSMEHLDNQIDLLTSAETSMEELQVSLEAAVADGEAGIDRKTAQVYAIATKAILGEAVEAPIASMESFGGETQNLEATQVSLEKVSETLTKIWKAIQRAVMNALKTVSDFAAKLFSSTDAMKKRAEAAKVKIEGLKKTNASAKSDKFKVPYASRLQMGGKVDTTTIDKGMKSVNDVLVGNVSGLAENAAKVYDKMALAYGDGAKMEEMMAEVRTLGNEYTSKIISKNVSAELPGGKALGTTTTTDGESAETTLSVPKLIDYSKRIKFNEKDEIATPSLDWAAGLVDGTLQLIKHLEGEKKVMDKLKSSRENAVKNADKLAAAVDSGKLEGVLTAAKARVGLGMVNRDFNGAVAKMNGYIFNYGRTLLSVAEAVADSYGEKKAEA